MSQIRFHVQDGDSLISTDWVEELVRHGPGEHTAVAHIGKLRPQYPNAAIRIERRGDVKIPSPARLFRYKIFVPSGTMEVVDDDGRQPRRLKNATLQSRAFQDSERETVRADIQTRFPDAQLTEEAL